MNGLMLHTGAGNVDRTQLQATPTPAATATWQPIPHWQLLTEVEQTLGRNQLEIVTENHGLTKDGARYFGLMQVRASGQDDDSNFGLMLGLRNSHDMVFPAGLVLGARVFVCDNLSFTGEARIARKHTRYIMRDLPQLVHRAVSQLSDLRRQQTTRFLTYQQTEVTDNEAHDLVIRALDARVIPVTRIPEVLTEWREPRHQEFREGGKTLWRLLNGFTEILKATNLDLLPRRTQVLQSVLDLHCNLLFDKPVAAIEQAPQFDQAV